MGARCSSVVERLFMVRWVIGSIPHSGPIELFHVPASAQRLAKQRPWYVLSCGMVHKKATTPKQHVRAAAGFLSNWVVLVYRTPYNRKQNVLTASLTPTKTQQKNKQQQHFLPFFYLDWLKYKILTLLQTRPDALLNNPGIKTSSGDLAVTFNFSLSTCHDQVVTGEQSPVLSEYIKKEIISIYFVCQKSIFVWRLTILRHMKKTKKRVILIAVLDDMSWLIFLDLFFLDFFIKVYKSVIVCKRCGSLPGNVCCVSAVCITCGWYLYILSRFFPTAAR